MDRKTVDSAVSALSDEAMAIFGDSYGQDVMTGIFASLNDDAFARHVMTPEDFRRYAHKAMEVAKLHTSRDSEDRVQIPYDIGTSTKRAMTDTAMLVRDDFDRDVDTVINTMRVTGPGISYSLKNIRDLIRTSDDLERVEKFAKRLSEHGFDAGGIFSGCERNYDHPGRAAIFGRQDAEEEIWDQYSRKRIRNPARVSFDVWKQIITDSEKLKDALSIVEVAFTRGVDTDDFTNELNRLPIEQRKRFIGSATAFAKKDIPPQFVAQNINALWSSDFRKDGLAIVPAKQIPRFLI